MNFRLRLLMTGATLLVGASLSGGAALAAETAAASTNTIEELVVTAEKRAQSLQDVPVAISAFTDVRRDLLGYSFASSSLLVDRIEVLRGPQGTL